MVPLWQGYKGGTGTGRGGRVAGTESWLVTFSSTQEAVKEKTSSEVITTLTVYLQSCTSSRKAPPPNALITFSNSFTNWRIVFNYMIL